MTTTIYQIIKTKYNIITTIILFIFCSYLSFFYFVKYEDEKKIQNLHYELNMKKKQLDSWLLSQKLLINDLSAHLELISLNSVDYLSHMRKTLKIMNANSIFCGLNDGQYFDTQGYWTENFDPRKRPWYKETIDAHDATISGPMDYIDITGKKIIWWAVSAPLVNSAQHYGVISAELLPSMFFAQLNNPSIQGIQLLLIHRVNGLIISSTQKNFEHMLFEDLFSETDFKHLQTSPNESFSIKYKNETVKIITKSLEEAPWILCAII